MTNYCAERLEAFKDITTATLTTVLLKKGLRNIWIRGSFPLSNDQERVVGPAFTLRFVPAREDLATPASWSSPISTRAAIEEMPEGCVAVVDAGGYRDAGIFGDILCERMNQKNVAALVTDGVVRDIEGVEQTQLSVWAAGTSSPPSVAGLTFVGWQEPIGCGGVAVIPNDLIVADKDGAVIVPADMVDEVLEASIEQENLEEWIINEVRDGAPLPGLYPPDEGNRIRYENSKK
ncbi:MAG: ribonuclease activity regulator RraA [Hyphomicrobiales bacterium]|nr:ribonuclease activity regulator RraA [Hyphomicrobiales bacterium]